ncbi:MAG TPA: PAS domain S-box protein, partial [Geothrix sp.]|nr:PAS domain S-box protein [Geothrix sp.]
MTSSSRTPRVTPATFARGMRIFLVVFNLLIVAFAAWALIQARQHEVARAEIATNNLAQVLEQSIKGTLRQIDMVLLSLKDQVEHASGGLRSPALAPFTATQFSRLGLLEALCITDAEGRVLQGLPSDARPKLGGQEYFKALKENPGAGLVISRPTRSALNGGWALTLARRLDAPDGSFAGAVCATLAIDRLAQAMALIDVGEGGSVSLRGQDLGLLARYPSFRGQDQMVGDTQVFGDYLAATTGSAPTAHFTAVSILDGDRRTYTLRKLDSPRFYILVGFSERDYLRAWRHQAAFAAAAVTALVGLTLAMGWLARSAWLRQLADQARLAAQEAKYRLLAENATDLIWSMDPQGRLTYVSPSILRQRGWTPEEFLALDPEFRAVPGAGARSMQARIAAAPSLPPGSQPFDDELIEARVRCKDGREIEVEAQYRLVWSEDGQLLGFQGVTRDITERKRMEAEREELIQELTKALADVRQLSGMLPICSQCKKVRDDQG